MRINKKSASLLPEIYLLASVIFYYISTASILNIVAIILFVIVAQQLYFKNALAGIVIGTIFLLINLYLILALVSELSEFTSFNSNGLKLAFVGFVWIGLNITMSIMMLKKYSSLKKPDISPSI